AIDNDGKENQALLAVIETVGPAGNQVDTQFNDSNVQSKVVGAGEEETFTGVAVQGGGGTIAGVEFRIDGGPWQAAQAADGAFNSETEDFNLTVNTAGLASGQHTIEARAVDNLGYVDDTPATVTLTVQAQLNATTVFLPFVVSS
ncbi:MAG: Ig-like domain-containing protein, partial [Anaerolineae bacterium]